MKSRDIGPRRQCSGVGSGGGGGGGGTRGPIAPPIILKGGPGPPIFPHAYTTLDAVVQTYLMLSISKPVSKRYCQSFINWCYCI